MSYTAKGLGAGVIVAMLVTSPSTLLQNPIKAITGSPILPLYAGIAGGIALSLCADRFNRLQRLERKVLTEASNTSESSSKEQS